MSDKSAIPATTSSQETPEIASIKGMDKEMKCRGFQFEPGQTYVHNGEVSVCRSGFHAVEGNPLEVFRYYKPGESRYFEVRQSGHFSKSESDGKVASVRIVIGAELSVGDLVRRAVGLISELSASTAASSGNGSAAASSGNASTAASSGYGSIAASSGNASTAASSGYGSIAASSGNASTAASSGYASTAASSGNGSTAASSGNASTAASSGNASTAASSGYASTAASSGNASTAASSGNASTAASSGYASTAASSGNGSTAASSGNASTAASSGYESTAASSGNASTAASSGHGSTAASSGYASTAHSGGANGKVRGAIGCALSLVYRNPTDGGILHAWAGIVGRDNIKPMTWYRLNQHGLPVEVE